MIEPETSRRTFLALAATALGCGQPPTSDNQAPAFLQDYAATYARNRRGACVEWFVESGIGVSFQYGLYSQIAPDPWVRFNKNISATDYDKLQASFTAESFDADGLVAFARDLGANYVRFPARLWDGFSLFRTNQTSFTSLNTPANRDLVGAMTDACGRAGIGLFLEYAYGLDWRHPYFYPSGSVKLDWPEAHLPNNEGFVRRFERDEDFLQYIKYAHLQLKEVLYRYEPLAGIALTPVMGYHARPDLFPLATAYGIIHEAQSQVLLSFEEGANGEEDFVSVRGDAATRGGETAERVRQLNAGKPREQLGIKAGGFGGNLVCELPLKADGSVPEGVREGWAKTL
jgi:hypothetical protein